MAEGLGEFRRQGENGVGHPLVIGVGVRQATLGQKLPVHFLPNAVGVDEGTVQVKEKHAHVLASFSSQKRQGKSLASWA